MINIILAVTNDIVTDNRVHKVATTLCNYGYQVTLVGRKLMNSENLYSRPYKTRRFKLWFNKSMLFYANYNLRLFFYLLRTPVDIIVANDLDTLVACWMASKIKRKVLVLDSHELFAEVPELINKPIIKGIWQLNERLLLPGIKFGYTVSKPIQAHFKKKYNKDFELIRNVGLFRFDQELKSVENEIIIIYQGAVNKGRGLELMIETMKHLSNARLMVVGGGDIINDLKAQVKKSELEEKVDFVGRVGLDLLWQYTIQAHVGISLEEDLGLNYRYALPNKIFDYIQARVPVVVSALPEMKSVVEQFGIGVVLEKREPQALAEKIKFLVSDKDFQKDLGRNLELAARDLCWQREEEKVIKLYRNAYEMSQKRNV